MDLLANFEVETKKMCLSCYNMLLTRFGFFFFFLVKVWSYRGGHSCAAISKSAATDAPTRQRASDEVTSDQRPPTSNPNTWVPGVRGLGLGKKRSPTRRPARVQTTKLRPASSTVPASAQSTARTLSITSWSMASSFSTRACSSALIFSCSVGSQTQPSPLSSGDG